MGNGMYRKGSNFERAVVDWHKRNGWQAIRSAGSHTSCDVVCWKLNRLESFSAKCRVRSEVMAKRLLH